MYHVLLAECCKTCTRFSIGYLQNFNPSAACSSLIGASNCMLHFCKEGMPLLCSLIRPATLQQHSQGACQLLLDQVRLLAGMPASTQTGWSLAMGAANTTLE